MPSSQSPTSTVVPRSARGLGFLNVAAFIGILYFAQDFLVPVVMAALVSFLLDPLNRWMERRGVKHIIAVLVTTTFTFVVMGTIIYLVTTQVLDLAAQLPRYKTNLVQK